MALAADMSGASRKIAFDDELRQHPSLTEAEARQAVLERMWGPELSAAVRRAGSRVVRDQEL